MYHVSMFQACDVVLTSFSEYPDIELDPNHTQLSGTSDDKQITVIGVFCPAIF